MPTITKQGKTEAELIKNKQLERIDDIMFKLINIDFKLNHARCCECGCEFNYGYEEAYNPMWTGLRNLVDYVRCPNCNNEVRAGYHVKMKLVRELSEEEYKKYYNKALDVYNKEHKLAEYKPVNRFKNFFKRR